MQLMLVSSRKLLLALGFCLGPTLATAGGAALLSSEPVRAAREGMADSVTRIAGAFMTDPATRRDPEARAVAMAQVAVMMADLLVDMEPRLAGDPVGDVFLDQGSVVVTCLGLASAEELAQQYAMLTTAAHFWRMTLPEPLEPDLCGSD